MLSPDDIQQVVNAIANDALLMQQLHSRSDLDFSAYAGHHTLGLKANQASSGSHTHDGKTSPQIKSFVLAGAYAATVMGFVNSAGAGNISVGDGVRSSFVGTATSSGDWVTGTLPGDMVLRSTNNRTVILGTIVGTSGLIFTAIGTRLTSVTGGAAVALPAQPVGYMGITINGTNRVIPYYT